MYICVCGGLTAQQLYQLIQNGFTCRQLAKLGIGSTCGQCIKQIKKIEKKMTYQLTKYTNTNNNKSFLLITDDRNKRLSPEHRSMIHPELYDQIQYGLVNFNDFELTMIQESDDRAALIDNFEHYMKLYNTSYPNGYNQPMDLIIFKDAEPVVEVKKTRKPYTKRVKTGDVAVVDAIAQLTEQAPELTLKEKLIQQIQTEIEILKNSANLISEKLDDARHVLKILKSAA